MRKSGKRFVFDTLLDEQNICNLSKEKKKLVGSVNNGDKILVYGKRNTGKTSLVRNSVIPAWIKKNPSGLYLYSDFMGVKSLEHVSERLTVSFNESCTRAFNFKTKFKTFLKQISGIRPVIVIGNDGRPSLSFTTESGDRTLDLREIFSQLDDMYRKGLRILIVIDEFQDIALVPQAEGLLRNSFQQLSPEIPVILMGSKQHMLTDVFSRQNAPFAGWGSSVEFSDIPFDEYHSYMNERFAACEISIEQDVSVYLQELLLRCPEAINRLCAHMTFLWGGKKKSIIKRDVDIALDDILSARRSEPEKYLSLFSVNEQKVITGIAKKRKVANPSGRDFVSETGVSMSGIRKIILKLENEAVIHRGDDGIVLSDPLLMHHIIRYRP